jgi:hypothetical protein
VSRQVGIYRRLLRLYPASFRRAFGDEMVQVFRDQMEDARSERLGTVRLWLRILGDLAGSSTHERMEDALNNHPVLTRALLVAIPAAILGGASFVGAGAAIPASALGLALLALRWRSVGEALRAPVGRSWWLVPALGAVLVVLGFGVIAMPGPGDLRWGLATLLGLVGILIATGSLLRSAFLLVRRRGATL